MISWLNFCITIKENFVQVSRSYLQDEQLFPLLPLSLVGFFTICMEASDLDFFLLYSGVCVVNPFILEILLDNPRKIFNIVCSVMRHYEI